ncbi:cellulose biosynthesis protein BcsS [Hyphomicrobium sp.]|uniref:cellulose biosynthesis protein BcsS n=1 Tax=Hyphomicrobium sp. TaxID=82 RepID=UPI0025BCDC9A|nr:cellulose biosynthesis protein BcsS [Hyphomicrobium sp.]MCC7252331.1 cellulose biosynthesis protein BcsS [Hyphomicrobium sp.]
MAGWRSVPICGCRRRRAWLAPAAAFVAGAALTTSVATASDEQASGRQVWAGADVSSHVWLVYSGVTFAPWSAIHDDGFRFRAAAGYGEYEYEKNPSRDPTPDRTLDFHARTYFADFLVGYLKRFGELTAKAFVGASVISHEIKPLDDFTVAMGEEVGIKGVLELWLNIGERGWGSLDMSWSSAHETRAARARLGYRVWPKLSIGLEAGINVDSQGECRMKGIGKSGCRNGYGEYVEPAELLDYARAGAFARYEWGRSELSLGAGVLGDKFARDDEAEIAPYVTINWLTQF